MLGQGVMALVLGLAAVPPPGDRATTAVVRAESLDVFGEPDASAFPLGQLRRGDRVVVRGAESDGWLAIDPPPGSLSWIDQDAIEDIGDGRAQVMVPRAGIRPGNAAARMPGGVLGSVEEGEEVRLLDRPPIQLKQGRSIRSWVAIEPPEGEVRYLRAEGVAIPRPGRRPRTDPIPEPLLDPPSPSPDRHVSRAAGGPAKAAPASPARRPSRGPALPPGFAASLSQVEAWHREAIRQPVEFWNLAPIRGRYQQLLGNASDTASRDAVRARLDQLAQQEAFARAAKDFVGLIERSRQRDRDLGLPSTPPDDREGPAEPGYDAEGLLQPSSKQIDGRPIYALVDSSGKTVYLVLPVGVRGDKLVTRLVGVRGRARYDENLRARVIAVDELERLDDAP
jgi:hypothetical protein